MAPGEVLLGAAEELSAEAEDEAHRHRDDEVERGVPLGEDQRRDERDDHEQPDADDDLAGVLADDQVVVAARADDHGQITSRNDRQAERDERRARG